MMDAGETRRMERDGLPRGMTLLETVIATVLFSGMLLVAYAALQSTRNFASTNATQIDLQEEARHGLEFIGDQLRNAGRFAENGNRTYPKLFKSVGGFPNGYNNANQHPPKINPKARPGSNANGGDPTLDSDEIIFKIPDGISIPNASPGDMPVMDASGRIVWAAEEYGFFIVPQTDGTNAIEFRNSDDSQDKKNNGQPVHGVIVARYVDRMQIQDYTTDPTLTSRQLRVTLYLTRVGAADGVPFEIIVALSTIVDMRNTSQLD